jgi:hypothetical protein
MLLSLAAGNGMVPLGDNRGAVRQLSQRLSLLRAADAARPARGATAPAAGERRLDDDAGARRCKS